MYTDPGWLGPETLLLAGQAESEKWAGLICERLQNLKKTAYNAAAKVGL